MGALDNLLGFNGTFGTGSPAEEAEKPMGPVGNLLLGLARSAATLPQRAIQNSQFALNTGNYDPGPTLEAATLPMGTGAIAGVPVRAGEAVLGSGAVRMAPERITGAAIQHEGQMFTGANHGEAYERAVADLGYDPFGAGDTVRGANMAERKNLNGFVTSTGRFVDRYEAGKIAEAAAQADKSGPLLAHELKSGYGADLIEGMEPHGMAGDPQPSIRAYHGSPHDFDAFSMDKIGTGEGAQAYGHGLYFADSEGVARSYRDALAPKFADSNRSQLAKQAASDLGTSSKYLPWAVLKEVEQGTPIDSIASKMSADPINRGRTLDELQNAVNYVKEKFPDHTASPGHMYEVNINADPAHFLDWDKPLSQQSEAVRNAIAAHPQADRLQGADMVRGGRSEPTGQAIVGRLGSEAPSLGIPGIKYLDQGSRTAGEGSSNYVVFKDDIINIVRKYAAAGIAVPPAIMAQYQKINEQQ